MCSSFAHYQFIRPNCLLLYAIEQQGSRRYLLSQGPIDAPDSNNNGCVALGTLRSKTVPLDPSEDGSVEGPRLETSSWLEVQGSILVPSTISTYGSELKDALGAYIRRIDICRVTLQVRCGQ